MDEQKPPRPDTDDLQFEKADYTDQNRKTSACESCNQAIHRLYYETGGKVICPECKASLETFLNRGTAAGRFIKASVFGFGAALLGAVIYYAIMKLTGYEFGLIALIIGLMVGAAVRAGSNRKGGWVYQCLAIFLTYMAIVSTYIPLIINEIKDKSQPGELSLTEDRSKAPDEKPPDSEPEDNSKKTVGFFSFILGVVIVSAFAMTVPFLSGFNNIIGLIIIGIGLYEAWKMNKRVEVQINGPFEITAGNTGNGLQTHES